MMLKNKKIWAIRLGTFIVSEILVGVLAPVSCTTSDKKQNKNVIFY